MQRRNRNNLSRIKNLEGVWVEGKKDILGAVEDFYRDLYSAPTMDPVNNCLHVIPNIVSTDMNDSLTTAITMGEVKSAVFSLGASKAPGPDGLNGLFYQKNWEILQHDVFQAVSSFFLTDNIGEFVNETIVSLIPKIPDLESISQLRPISCCNFIYKVISKVMVSILKPLLNKLISPQQSAFVGGRLIQDNLMVAQEAFHYLRKKRASNNCGFAIKLDMNKAYDRVDWNFLRAVLISFGFSPMWVSSVMSLVSSVKYSYQVNGSRSKVIVPSRGLRQGDPLSPYLFILVFDVFSRLISYANSIGLIKGLTLAKDAPTLTHLFFADDSVLFGRASKEEMFQVVKILNDFTVASGQMINLQKSGIIFGK